MGYQNGYRRIKNTGKGSDWYGDCERCGKKCSPHYKQQTKHSGGWSTAGFGHVDCLRTGEFSDAPVEHDPYSA